MRGIHSTPDQRAKLHASAAYAQQTYGRPVTRTQCVGCGKLASEGLTTWVIGADGLCPTCKKRREPHRDVIHLFKPLRTK